MSLYLWDTDHFSLFQRGHPQLTARFQQTSLGEVAVTVITAEELIRGRLAKISAAPNEPDRVEQLRWFSATLELLKDFPVQDYTDAAQVIFEKLRRQKLRIGSQDMRIAAITLATSSILVTRNAVDFNKVPGLTIQDWTV